MALKAVSVDLMKFLFFIRGTLEATKSVPKLIVGMFSEAIDNIEEFVTDSGRLIEEKQELIDSLHTQRTNDAYLMKRMASKLSTLWDDSGYFTVLSVTLGDLGIRMRSPYEALRIALELWLCGNSWGAVDYIFDNSTVDPGKQVTAGKIHETLDGFLKKRLES